MDIFDLLDKLEEIGDDNLTGCPDIYIQIGNMQVPLRGVKYFSEIDGVCDECIVLGDSEEPKLIL